MGIRIRAIALFILILSAGRTTWALSDNLRLLVRFPGGTIVTLDPDTYTGTEMAGYRALAESDRTQFLQMRREKLGQILKLIRARVLDENPGVETNSKSKFAATFEKFAASFDRRLFRSCRLVFDSSVRGNWYTAHGVAYFGWLNKVWGWGLEFSVIRKFDKMKQTMRTTLVMDVIKVKGSTSPIPTAFLGGRFIRFIEGQDQDDLGLEVIHFPVGPVLSTGPEHIGAGFATGLVFPPPPIGALSGFTVDVKRHNLWSCESALAAARLGGDKNIVSK